MIGVLRRERRFAALLTGNLLSQIGDGVHEFIFIVAVLKATSNNVGLAGLLYFFRFIPYLVLGPLGGALSDRLSRRSLMVFADLARISITCIFCVLLSKGDPGLPSLALIGMLMTSFRTLFQPAFQGIIPSMVRAEHLPVANGATQLAVEIGGLVGPALGALALSAIGNAGYVLVLDAATYFLSALCIMRVVAKPGTRPDVTTSFTTLTIRGLYGDFGHSVKEVLMKRELFITIACSALCILFVSAALRILIPSMLKGTGYSETTIGYAMSAIALGAIAGSALCARMMRDFSTRMLMLCWSFYGIALAVMPTCTDSVFTVLSGCFALGGLGAFVDVILPTNIQRHSTDANLGKNFSLFSTLANTGEALSGALAGTLAVVASVGTSLIVIGVLIASVAYVGKIKTVSRHA
jgi:MFS family permease